MLVTCAICGCAAPFAWPCAASHPDHCHACWSRNLASGFDARAHRGPTEALVLPERAGQALVAYHERVRRLDAGEEA